MGDSTLHFCGPNACLGYWSSQAGLAILPPDRWVDTGDSVRVLPTDAPDPTDSDLFFTGRVGDSFKLANGRFVQAGLWQTRLREAFPGLGDALLYSPDDRYLVLLVNMDGPEVPTFPQAAALLGPLGSLLADVRYLSSSMRGCGRAKGAWFAPQPCGPFCRNK